MIDYTLRGKRFYDFSVQFYRDNATDLAKTLLMYHQTPDGLLYLQTANFLVRRIDNLSEAASVLSQNYEERAALDVQLYVSETQTVTVSKITKASIELIFSEASDITETIEVDKDG